MKINRHRDSLFRCAGAKQAAEWLAVGLFTGLLLIWLVSGPAGAEELFQNSPFTSPQSTVTPTVTPTLTEPTPSPTLSPTPTLLPSDTPTAVITATLALTPTLDPALQPPGPADPTPIPSATPTVDLAGLLAPLAVPTIRPVTVPTPTPAPDRVLLAAALIDRAVSSLAWLWLLCGSFLFFVVAGVVVGLGLTGRIANRRRPYPDDGTGYMDDDLFAPTNNWTAPSSSQVSGQGSGQQFDRPSSRGLPPDDDNWPASLP